MAHFAITPQVYIGADALKEAAPQLRTIGKKALIVTGKHVGKSSMMDALKKTLIAQSIGFAIYDEITGEPTDPMIVGGVKTYQESGCDFVIGLGGGSPLDSAKAIAAMSVNPGKISDYAGKEITGELPKIVAIPTTAGTGSETTKFTIISDPTTNVKMLLKGDVLVPDLAVLDPDYTIDMPRSVTACTGLDALTHAIEAYTSKKAMAFTDAYAIDAVKKIMKYLPDAYRDGGKREPREKMMEAAFEAGVCINNSSVTIVHGMSRPIGALFHVPHGMSNAMLLDVCLNFILDGAADRFANLGRAIGVADEKTGDETAGKAFLSEVIKLVHLCGIPTLWEYGVDKSEFEKSIEKMAEDAMASGSPANTRKSITKEDCVNLYKRLLIPNFTA